MTGGPRWPRRRIFRLRGMTSSDLTDELSKFAKEKKLSKEQWALLLAIFAVAADHVEVERVGATGKFSGVAIGAMQTRRSRAPNARLSRSFASSFAGPTFQASRWPLSWIVVVPPHAHTTARNK